MGVIHLGTCRLKTCYTALTRGQTIPARRAWGVYEHIIVQQHRMCVLVGGSAIERFLRELVRGTTYQLHPLAAGAERRMRWRPYRSGFGWSWTLTRSATLDRGRRGLETDARSGREFAFFACPRRRTSLCEDITTGAFEAHIGVGPSVPKSVPKEGPKPVIRQPTPTMNTMKNGPEIVNFRPVL